MINEKNDRNMEEEEIKEALRYEAEQLEAQQR